jgi:hypothetical protein
MALFHPLKALSQELVFRFSEVDVSPVRARSIAHSVIQVCVELISKSNQQFPLGFHLLRKRM